MDTFELHDLFWPGVLPFYASEAFKAYRTWSERKDIDESGKVLPDPHIELPETIIEGQVPKGDKTIRLPEEVVHGGWQPEWSATGQDVALLLMGGLGLTALVFLAAAMTQKKARTA